MLLGVRERLGDSIVRDGHRLRIYVPFGEHWYEYSLRRLQENPAVAGHIARDTDRALLPSAAATGPAELHRAANARAFALSYGGGGRPVGLRLPPR